MAAPPPLPKGLRVSFTGTYGTTKWACIQHATYASGPPSTADLNTMAGSLATIFNTDLMYACAGGVMLTQVALLDIASSTGQQGLEAVNLPGNTAGISLPANTAMVLSWTINRRYRGGHTRTYLPGISNTFVGDQRTWDQTKTPLVLSHAQSYISAFNAVTSSSSGVLTLGQASFFKGKNVNGKPIPLPVGQFDPIVGVKIHQRIDSQRRRLGKEGP